MYPPSTSYASTDSPTDRPYRAPDVPGWTGLLAGVALLAGVPVLLWLSTRPALVTLCLGGVAGFLARRVVDDGTLRPSVATRE